MTKITHEATKYYEEKAVEANAKKVGALTLKLYEPFWMNSFYLNLEKIRNGRDTTELPRPGDKTGLVIGSGPSVEKYNQLEYLAEHVDRDRFTIIVTDSIYRRCIQAGLIPDYVTCLDGEPKTRNFFDGVPKNDVTKAIVSVTYFPKTVDLIAKKMPIYWWMPLWDDPLAEGPSVTRILGWLTAPLESKTLRRKRAFMTFGNVGGFSWYFSNFLGTHGTYLVGIDYGYPADTEIETTQYYNGYLKHVHDGNVRQAAIDKEMQERNPQHKPQPPATIEDCYRLIENYDTGKKILVGMNWDAYRHTFLAAAKSCPQRTVILSPESSLFGEGIETMDIMKVIP